MGCHTDFGMLAELVVEVEGVVVSRDKYTAPQRAEQTSPGFFTSQSYDWRYPN